LDSYLRLVRETLQEGNLETSRTGINTLSLFGKTLTHDVSKNNFPLLTTKFIPIRLIASELEFFIKGITDKRWLQARNNHIWDDWANPEIIRKKFSFSENELEDTLNNSYKNFLEDKEIIQTPRLKNLFLSIESYFKLEQEVWKQIKPIKKEDLTLISKNVEKITQYIERDLGPIYGFQWRHFGANYLTYKDNYTAKGYDQLKFILETLEKEPSSRRMIISAWDPTAKGKMALEPCHYNIQFNVSKKKLNLLWSQRSIDLMLGLPFNIASYALLLKLMSKEVNLDEGKIVGMLGNVHIYENHRKGAEEQIKREPKKLPGLHIPNYTNIYDWVSEQVELENYNSDPTIKFPIAV
jgi:thymidylate synthase